MLRDIYHIHRKGIRDQPRKDLGCRAMGPKFDNLCNVMLCCFCMLG